MKIGEAIYKTSGANSPNPEDFSKQDSSDNSSEKTTDEKVVDGEFNEVKDDKKS